MAYIGQNLETKGIIIALLSLVLVNISCEDKIDNPAVNPLEGKIVEVSLNIGLADEISGFTYKAATTKASSGKGAFDITLEPSVITKASTTKPDKLYNLEIVQYDNAGTFKARKYFNGETTIGSRLDMTLAALEDCQLVIVAWGMGNSTTLGETNLSTAQGVTVDASVISPITEANMNKMPYVLHLEHVCVEGNTIKSIEGEGEDVRLLLRRLATRLTLRWSYTYSDYELKQILLQSIPLNYKVVAAPDDKEKTYPSLLDQFTTIQLTEKEIKAKEYSCWMPANVRGTNSAATSQAYRIKSNAPIGSSYVDFIATNTTEVKKKLSYRVYLGGSKLSDFDLYSNTDYNYTVTINHTDLPVNDRRVTIIDPIPASENNNNLVPTGNCFMVVPGGAFCFNPYKYYINGAITDNSLLQSWCSSTKIQSVKVLWQTKENGDVGDPVLGVVNSSEDHTNIVDIMNNDNTENARIYCRVAPNTEGGSGVIAAYDGANGTGNILWSWHIWVTDYTPDAKTDVSVDEPNKRIQKYTYGGKTQYPMMDRNLGAKVGYTDIPKSFLERSKSSGFHYQWGRKDPFPSSYSETNGTKITIKSDKPTPDMLNLYQPDGITFFARGNGDKAVSIQVAYQNPSATYSSGGVWCSDGSDQLWNDAQNKKTVHDPCPAGWRIASKVNYRPFFTNTGYTDSGVTTNANIPMNLKNNDIIADGGAVLYFEEKTSGRSTYIRMTGYQPYYNEFNYIGGMGNLWCREKCVLAIVEAYFPHFGYVFPNRNISTNWAKRDAHPLRCIQDRL